MNLGTISPERGVNVADDTVAVITLRESQIEPLSAKGILHVRPLATAAA